MFYLLTGFLLGEVYLSKNYLQFQYTRYVAYGPQDHGAL